jgi:hypothetical protein
VTAHEGAPGRDGLRARRIVAEALARESRADDARALLEPIAASSEADLADAARARLAVLDPAGKLDPALAARVEQGQDASAVRLLATLAARADDANAEKRLVDRALSLAKDEALALLRRAQRTRGRLRPAKLRAADDAVRADLDAFFAFAGEEGERVPEALYLRAISAFAARRFDDCLRDLDRALDLGMEGVDVHAARGWFPDERGMKAAEKARELDPKRANAARLGRAERIELAASASPEIPKRIDALVAAAIPPARDALRAALQASARGEPEPRVAELFEKAVRAGQSCAVVGTEHARFLATRGAAAAEQEIVRARSLTGANPHELLALEVEWSDRRGRKTDARRLATKLRDEPTAGTYAEIGRSTLARLANELNDAEAYARRAIAQPTTEAAGRRQLVLALYMKRESDKAFEEALLAVRLDGRLDPHALYLGLRSAQYSGDDENDPLGDVRGTWENLLEVAPAPSSLYWFARTYAQGAKGAPFYERVKKVDPGSPYGDDGLGIVAIDKDATTTAADAWNAALKLEPRWRFPRDWVQRLTVLKPSLGKDYVMDSGE